ncbi:MAG: C40 family peptidase [Paucibacter sp.]|nr:C40 family peptidase [Roseateles sp.]
MLDARPRSPLPLKNKPTLRRLTAGMVGLLLCVSMSASRAQNNAPPPGMVTGAWGFSQLPTHGVTAAPLPVVIVADTSAPATAGADPVSRFLQERGLLAQAGQLPQGQSDPVSLLNQVRDTASNLVIASMNFLGVRYTRGGSSVESGFDCSGFTRHIFESSLGLVLPRRADEQAKMSNLLSVKRDELKPGDLVFFNTMKRTFSHVGIYVGEGKFIHSPRVGGAVRVEDMREAYWSKRFTGARRADLKAAADGSR